MTARRLVRAAALGLLLACTHAAALAEGEYFVTTTPQERILSQELQQNARLSPARFDAGQDVAKLPAWFLGTCVTPTEEYHLLAYFSTPLVAWVGLFSREKQLLGFWKFPCDARQLYVEGSKLKFVRRPQMHEDTADSFAKVPRETVFDFATFRLRTFRFHGLTYTLPE